MATQYREEQLYANRRALESVNHAVDLGLTAQNITDANTVAGLRTKIEALSVPEASLPVIRQCSANVQAAKIAGVLADADILSLTTVAGLRAVFTTIDSSLSATENASFGFTNV